MLILATDIPSRFRVQSRIDPNKHDDLLQMQKWGDCTWENVAGSVLC